METGSWTVADSTAAATKAMVPRLLRPDVSGSRPACTALANSVSVPHGPIRAIGASRTERARPPRALGPAGADGADRAMGNADGVRERGARGPRARDVGPQQPRHHRLRRGGGRVGDGPRARLHLPHRRSPSRIGVLPRGIPD